MVGQPGDLRRHDAVAGAVQDADRNGARAGLAAGDPAGEVLRVDRHVAATQPAKQREEGRAPRIAVGCAEGDHAAHAVRRFAGRVEGVQTAEAPTHQAHVFTGRRMDLADPLDDALDHQGAKRQRVVDAADRPLGGLGVDSESEADRRVADPSQEEPQQRHRRIAAPVAGQREHGMAIARRRLGDQIAQTQRETQGLEPGTTEIAERIDEQRTRRRLHRKSDRWVARRE